MSTCPGCGRCRECGQPATVPSLPYPYTTPYVQPNVQPCTYPVGRPIWISPYVPSTPIGPTFTC